MTRSNIPLIALLSFLGACQGPAAVSSTAVAQVPSGTINWALAHTYRVEVRCPDADMNSSGSAVNIGDEYAVTAKHVVEPWDPHCGLSVKTHAGQTFTAILMETYPDDDLALLFIPGHVVPLVPFGVPVFGLPVMAVGYPGGKLSVTFGHIAGFPEEDREVRFTAPIYYGSSGGGVWDLNGNLVGISVNGYFDRPLWFGLVPADRIRVSSLVN